MTNRRIIKEVIVSTALSSFVVYLLKITDPYLALVADAVLTIVFLNSKIDNFIIKTLKL